MNLELGRLARILANDWAEGSRKSKLRGRESLALEEELESSARTWRRSADGMVSNKNVKIFVANPEIEDSKGQ